MGTLLLDSIFVLKIFSMEIPISDQTVAKHFNLYIWGDNTQHGLWSSGTPRSLNSLIQGYWVLGFKDPASSHIHSKGNAHHFDQHTQNYFSAFQNGWLAWHKKERNLIVTSFL